MASFEQHVNGAVLATGVLVVPFYSASVVDINEALVLFCLGILGGVLPDIDSDNSKPIQISFKILSIFVPFIVILSTISILSVTNILFIWLASSLVLHFGVFRVFLSITSHRGIFHSIPMGILFGLITIFLFNTILNLDSVFATLSGIFLFVGFMVHLLLDELVSLNVLGLHIKKSFGTAVKLYDKNNAIGSIGLYIAIAILSFVVSIDFDVFESIANSFENIKF